MAKLCLNMIVKNESVNLPRCLASFFPPNMPPIVDAYVIADTGSTDDTIDLIQGFFAARGIPGRVVRTTFQNFEQARNEALDAARQSDLAFDYLLLCDADMELVVQRPFKDALTGEAYSILQRHTGGTLEYPNIRLLRRDVPAAYRGVTHEYLDVGNRARPVLAGVHYLDHASGSNRTTKYERDIALLTEFLRQHPDDPRSVFYLANSYYDSGQTERAIAEYERRIALGGWDQERFISGYRIALCHQRLGDEANFTRRMVSTFDAFPTRAEPLHALALNEQRAGRHASAYMFARAGSDLPKPQGALFVEPEVYDWRLVDIMAVSLYYLGRRDEALKLNERLLSLAPASQHERIRDNVRWCLGQAPRATGTLREGVVT